MKKKKKKRSGKIERKRDVENTSQSFTSVNVNSRSTEQESGKQKTIEEIIEENFMCRRKVMNFTLKEPI